jgi:hypothetical protein
LRFDQDKVAQWGLLGRLNSTLPFSSVYTLTLTAAKVSL